MVCTFKIPQTKALKQPQYNKQEVEAFILPYSAGKSSRRLEFNDRSVSVYWALEPQYFKVEYFFSAFYAEIPLGIT